MENTPPEAIAIPPALLAEVQAAANEEHRPAGDVVREALERYLRERRWQEIFAYGEERARALGLGLAETDIPRPISEYRQQHR